MTKPGDFAHSSSTEGFFQTLPTIEPQYTLPVLVQGEQRDAQSISDDPVLARILQQYLPPRAQATVGASIHKLSRRVLEPAILSHATEAETNVPILRPLTTFGQENRNDPLWTCAGWNALKDIGIEEGIVARAYDQGVTTHNRRIDQFGHAHVWSHSSAMTMCPMSMVDGAAKLLLRHKNDADGDQPGLHRVIAESYRRLTSTDPSEAWTSGQWMTERTGGSDVSGTETVARRLSDGEIASDTAAGRDKDAIGLPLGPWRLDGFKWFSSATDSDMTVLLARTPKGISAFYMPLRRGAGGAARGATELNGVRIQRLKSKLGTRALPTAELEIRGARGWLLGEEGRGVKEISAILNITRIHAAAGSAAYWARGLAVCRAYSKVRLVRGRPLRENAQHAFWMARETVRYWAAAHLTFFGAALLGCGEQGWEAAAAGSIGGEGLVPRAGEAREALLRLLTPVVKAQVSLASVRGLREAMECLGGVGYCENSEDGGVLNVAKMFRDAIANTIWEGTASVMAEDVRRVLADRRIARGNAVEAVFGAWAAAVLDRCRPRFAPECDVVRERLQALVAVVQTSGPAELEYRSRDVLEHIEAVTAAALLLYNAHSDGDQVASHVASRYVRSIALPNSRYQLQAPDWKSESDVDYLIFLGKGYHSSGGAQEKL
ncbi:acyl-CoA dehydrogenase/oxidase [Durotheca rogersii]|uniref:acyl-CoA dehydrogenase/oxidase n=1 Tax=Durotheca rogersii TaxID=419775 RepID=UPI00221ED7FF|nr:acyl-CoA dehydrogenase/oxidase [Durotheca rogersii]KAI5855034.1 acyl-CoA dehydrogenase/oxidase [Durotheca rogersii]